MDLIYADTNKREIGVLFDYSYDLAYGASENNFELTIDLDNHCCQDGYFVYCINDINGKIVGTEYGGIIDEIKVDTESNKVVYYGRTWHGIIGSKTIDPLNGYDYYAVEGEAHSVLKELLNYLELGDLFEVDNSVSEIDIPYYQFRYDNAYAGINSMIKDNGGKLIFQHKKDMVIISVVPFIDYSIDEEWDSSQVDFTIAKNYSPINHLICLGQGDLSNRYVIHLFTDENGGVLPYAKTDNPKQDSDYILDLSQQRLFRLKEIKDIYDYPNAEVVENYIELLEQPSDWIKNYTNYFLFEDDKYSEIKENDESTYSLLTSQPSDWSKKYNEYYTKGDKNYSSVQGITTPLYKKLSKKPKDWNKNYANYYYYYTDGVTSEYRSIEGITKYRYKIQTRKPTDWKNNYSQYYKRKKKGGYETVKGVKKGKKEYAPVWKAKKYYVRETYSIAPKYKSVYYYKYKEKVTAPIFEKETYYKKTTNIIIPSFVPRFYYKKVYDNYAKLVEGGLNKLLESYDSDKISMDIDKLDGNYDINDIVGANEIKSGLSVWQPITKKIVKIDERTISLKYEIGGK